MTNDTNSSLLQPFVGLSLNSAARAIFAIVGSVMILCGVTGNMLLLTVIFGRFRPKRYMHDLFNASLSVADTVTLGYWLTFFVLDLILGFYPVVNQVHCEVNGMIFTTSNAVSILSLLSISVNRYLYVRHSQLHKRLFTWPRTKGLCIGIWVVSILVALPPALKVDAGVYLYSTHHHVCTLHVLPLSYAKIGAVLFSVAPMIVIGYCNYSIFRFWKKAQNELCGWAGANTGEGLSSRWQQRQEKSKETKAGMVHSSLEDTERRQNGTETAFQDCGEDDTRAFNEANKPNLPGRTQSCADDDNRPEGGTEHTDRAMFFSAKIGKRSTEWCVETTQSISGAEFSGQKQTEDGADCSTVEDSSHFSQTELASETNSVSGGLSSPDSGGETTEEMAVEMKTMPTPVVLLQQSVSHSSMLSPRKTLSEHSGVNHGTAATKNVLRQQLKKFKKPSAREVAFVRSLFVIFLLACISFFPFAALIALNNVISLPLEVRIFTLLLMVFNNSVNWAVYGLMSPSFRKAYKACVQRLLEKCCPCQQK